MRGIDRYNFPAFDDCAAFLTRRGDDVISPADLDRALGLDETADELPDWFTLEDAMRRDLSAVIDCDRIVLLPGWSTSEGATREVLTAIWCGMPVYRYFPDPASPKVVAATNEEILYAIHSDIAIKGND